MRKSHITLLAPCLAVVFGLVAASSASARHPYGWYYAGYVPYAPAVVAVPGYGPGVGYVAVPYGYVYSPHRAYRQLMRYGYPPLPPRFVAPVYAYPAYGYGYYGYVPPPAPVRGPRDYIYQPAQPSYKPQYKQPAAQPAPMHPAPLPQPTLPSESGPELIPVPAGEP